MVNVVFEGPGAGVGMKPEKIPLRGVVSSGWQGLEKDDWVTVWFCVGC